MSQRDPNAPMGPIISTSGAPTIWNGVLYEHGNQRVLQPNEVADATKYVSDYYSQGNSNQPSQGPTNDPRTLNDAYRQYTGRDGDAAGMAAHQRNPGGFAGAINAIRYSPEAGAYQQSQLQSAIAGVPQGSRTTNPGTGGPAADLYSATQKGITQPSVYTGYTPKYAMEGFDFSREQNTGKSAKDAFAYLANQAPPPPQDKAALGAWFQQYIQPGMDQLGHKVSSVTGDKFTYGNHEGTFEVDFARGADAPGGALAWQSDPINGGTANARPYVPIVGVPRPGTSGTGGPRPGIDYIPNMPYPQAPELFKPNPLPGQFEPQQSNNMADYYDYLRQFLASQQESI